MERFDCIAGINTNPFSPVSAKTAEDRFIDGITVSNGVLAARPNPRFDALVFYSDDAAIEGESAGVTEAELALILERLGAYDGLNFDGGGSTALVLRSLRPEDGNPYGRPMPVNVPIHKQIPGWQRAVANCLGIRVGGRSE
jgi:hypothetical protein